jgi:hypothetical protein
MTTRLNLQPVLFTLFTTALILSLSFSLPAQDTANAELKDFKITIERTQEGVQLECKEGCAWKSLSFSANGDKPQAVDEYGMTDLNKNPSQKDSNLADFLFTVAKTDKGISLQGMEGTAWKDLSFYNSIKNTQDIDQYGMTEFN